MATTRDPPPAAKPRKPPPRRSGLISSPEVIAETKRAIARMAKSRRYRHLFVGEEIPKDWGRR